MKHFLSSGTVPTWFAVVFKAGFHVTFERMVRDCMGLEAYCTVYARWREAERQLNQSGLTILKDNGDSAPSPYVKIAEDSLKQLRAWASEFGLSPASRSRVSVAKKPTSVLDDGRDWFDDHPN